MAWTSVRAGDVEVFSDADGETTLDFAVKLQRMRAAMAKVSRFRVAGHTPTRVFLFRSGSELEPMLAEIFGTAMKRSGVFTSHGDRHDIAIDASARNRSEQVMYHEVTHSLAHSAWGPTPLWLDEGLAEVYSTFNASGNEVFVGKPPRSHVVRMLRTQPLSMASLLTATIRSDVYTSPITQRLFYAQAWAIVHYILCTHPNGSEELARYVTLTNGGTPPEVAFERAFSLRVADMPRTLRDYMRRVERAGWFRFTLDELAAVAPSAPQPIPDGELRVAFDELLGRSVTRAAATLSPMSEEREIGPPSSPAALERANHDLVLGRLDDAVYALRFIARSPDSDGDVRKRAADMADELEQNRARNRHVELFNEAVDLAENKEWRAALEILDALIPELTDDDICASAGALQAELRRVLKRK